MGETFTQQETIARPGPGAVRPHPAGEALARTGGSPEPAAGTVQRLHSPTDVIAAFGVMGRSARREVLEMVPERDGVGQALQASRGPDIGSLEREVSSCLICESSCVADTRLRAELEVRLDAGAEIRLVRRTPQWLRLFDARAAVLPSPAPSDALLVYERAVIKSLRALFATVWQHAVGYSRDGAGPRGLGTRHRQVLRLLNRGDTDEAAARQMDVSVRTYRRYVAEAMHTLGAQSRFQAGALAAAQGWL